MTRCIVFLLVLAATVFSCRKEPEGGVTPLPDRYEVVRRYLHLDSTALNYQAPQAPAHLAALQTTLPLNNALVELGRVLFYDRSLSSDGTISCAGCHHQKHAFADSVAVSPGVGGLLGTRNAMPLLNIPSFGGMVHVDSAGNTVLPLFWDSRSFSLPDQSEQAFTNPKEMGLQPDDIAAIAAGRPYYPLLFERAWGDSLVTRQRVLLALTHFMNALRCNDTKFDRSFAQLPQPDLHADLPGFTVQENTGKNLYLQHCHSCHGSLNSIQPVYEANNGLENPYTDKGKGAISGKFYENGTFRVPGLRNIAHTAPYMHDGRFTTLEQVIEHYNSGVVKGFGLHGDLLEYDENTGTYSAKRLHLSEQEKEALKTFLHTLTDDAALADPRFSSPFK